jgi:hypothetical protein
MYFYSGLPMQFLSGVDKAAPQAAFASRLYARKRPVSVRLGDEVSFYNYKLCRPTVTGGNSPRAAGKRAACLALASAEGSTAPAWLVPRPAALSSKRSVFNNKPV